MCALEQHPSTTVFRIGCSDYCTFGEIFDPYPAGMLLPNEYLTTLLPAINGLNYTVDIVREPFVDGNYSWLSDSNPNSSSNRLASGVIDTFDTSLGLLAGRIARLNFS